MATTERPQLDRPLRYSTALHAAERPSRVSILPYIAIGILLGVTIVKGEILSWYRIQEMFRFQAFHMYGVLGSAFFTAFISLRMLRYTNARTVRGEQISVEPKEFGSGRRYWIGGMIFGAGWALTGACPGPLFALIGSGYSVFLVTALAALSGTWVYGILRPSLPH